MIGAVVAAVLAAGAVTPWTSPSGVESVARAWEPQGGARCHVVFLPGDEDPAQDRSAREAYRDLLLELMAGDPRLCCLDSDTGLFNGADLSPAGPPPPSRTVPPAGIRPW